MSDQLSLRTRIARWLAPSVDKPRTRYDVRQEPTYLANQLDVDRLHGALRQAEEGDVRELFTIYRDCLLGDTHIQAEFTKRKLAVLGDPLTVSAKNKRVPADVFAANSADAMIDEVPQWIDALSKLMDSVLWPVSILEKVWMVEDGAYRLRNLIPVPEQLLDYTSGSLKIRDTDARGFILGTSCAPDPARYIIHRGHLLSMPDNWGGPMRSILFWWLLGNMDRDWWARFLDRYGSPFMVGKYDTADDTSRSLLERAFSAAVRIGGLVISKETDVEIKQASSQGSAAAYSEFYTVSRREISKLIVGQTLSAEAQATGMGSGVSDQHGEVRQDYRQFDGMRLGETLKDQLIRQFMDINGIPGAVPSISWGGPSPTEAIALGEMLSKFFTAGIEVADEGLDSLSERTSLPLRRKITPMALTAMSAPDPMRGRSSAAEDANDAIARETAADLAQSFRGSLAPVRKIIADSSSAAEFAEKVSAFYSDWPAEKAAAVIERGLIAFAVNGVSR